MASPGTSHHDSDEDSLVEPGSYEDLTKPLILNEIYTELYITEGDLGDIHDEHEVIDSRGNFVTDDRSIKRNDIFEPLPGRRWQTIRTVLTKGIAGIGKSVCVQKFVMDWVDLISNQDMRYVYPLSFRELNLLKDKQLCLSEILSPFGEFKDEDLAKSRQLFIFDGLDECRLPLDFENNEKLCQPGIAASLDVLLTNLIQGNLFPSCLVWITSRPAAAGRIPPALVDRVTTVQGFGDPQKDEFFRKRIRNPALAEKVITHIRSIRSLHIMCHIPFFCRVAATVLQRLLEEADDCVVPKNLSQMYTRFVIIQTEVMAKKNTQATDSSRTMIIRLRRLALPTAGERSEEDSMRKT